ncbi:speckle-type POZ protein-like isoform X2 [Neocloeon triangulifer]|nr:speckle-type POZ protein-like isoform X2 [Neocloeon triangulifer]XP_059469877.1 speckle-type POZ protein-like isoform X2 [Neocloeon triangulifer]
MEDGVEILVPSASDVVYKYTWNIKKFGQSCRKRHSPVFDSEAFELNVNGLRTRWNLSIRFWTGMDGSRLMSPVVACLNLLRCWPEDLPGTQATVRFQFGVLCRQNGRYEMTPLARSIVSLGATKNIVSVGHQDVEIVEKHMLSHSGDIRLVCKVQVVPTGSDDEQHSLSQDMGSLLCSSDDDLAPSELPWAKGDVKLRAAGGALFPAHCCILGARSPRLAGMISDIDEKLETTPTLELSDLTAENLQEILRYIYTGRVENLDSVAASLLGAAYKYELPGLTTLCERSLLETLDAESVAARLLLADEFGCDALKRGALAFVEGHAGRMPKNMAWSVMEMVRPELFQEAIEAGIGDSASSFASSLSEAGSNSR